MGVESKVRSLLFSLDTILNKNSKNNCCVKALPQSFKKPLESKEGIYTLKTILQIGIKKTDTDFIESINIASALQSFIKKIESVRDSIVYGRSFYPSHYGFL